MPVLIFPNEPPDYRQARDELAKAEMDLKRQVDRTAALRRRMPLGGVLKEDYIFEELGKNGRVRKVKLSELFDEDKDSLFLYSFMYSPDMPEACPMCSSFLDGLNGSAPHIMQRMNLAVVARSPLRRVVRFAKARGWKNLRILSSARNSYNVDYFGETTDGKQDTMANVFTRRDGVIYHFWGTEKQYARPGSDPCHMDMMWPLWNVLDTTPEGRGDWYPPLNVTRKASSQKKKTKKRSARRRGTTKLRRKR